MNELNLESIRAEFPALAGGTVYLDNAGGSQVLRRVADRVRDYLLTSSVQLGASYAASVAAGEKVLAARRAVAELVNAPFDDEVVMGGATTALMFMLTQALMPGIQPGDEVIVTDTDHEANIGGWMRLQQAGAVVKVWQVNRDSLALEPADLDRLLGPRTRWLAMTWASNILGTVNPVDEVARRVHAVGARLCVDAVAYAPHRLVDVQASGADVVVFSFYKVFGPHYAVMWVRRELLLSLPSLNHFFIGPDVLPYKLQPGNVNYELCTAASASTSTCATPARPSAPAAPRASACRLRSTPSSATKTGFPSGCSAGYAAGRACASSGTRPRSAGSACPRSASSSPARRRKRSCAMSTASTSASATATSTPGA